MQSKIFGLPVVTFLIFVILYSKITNGVLPVDATLSIDGPAISGATKPANSSGSWFMYSFTRGPGLIDLGFTGISGNDGLILGQAQPGTSTQCILPPCPLLDTIDDTTYFPRILTPYPVNHITQSPITVLSEDGSGNVTLDFLSWSLNIEGGYVFDAGTYPAFLDNNGDGVTDHPDGVATLTCTNDCSSGDSYVLDYSAFYTDYFQTDIMYIVHLEGTVNGSNNNIDDTLSGSNGCSINMNEIKTINKKDWLVITAYMLLVVVFIRRNAGTTN